MYRKQKTLKTSIKRNESYVGETIEQKINRIINNREPITDGAPLIYTDRKDGAMAAHDIRTDRWEVAIEAMDKVTKSNLAKREAKAKVIPIDDKPKEAETKGNIGGAEPIQGTGGDGGQK